MTTSLLTFDTITDDFAYIDDWDEKYRYIIDLGRQLPELLKDEKTEQTRIRGCASQVWLVLNEKSGALSLRGDSDAAIVKGLVAIIIALYDGMPITKIAAIDAEAALKTLGLDEHITPQRANGVASMVREIRRQATTI